MQIVAMRRDLRDAVALDDDVHVLGDGACRGRRTAAPHAPSWSRWCVAGRPRRTAARCRGRCRRRGRPAGTDRRPGRARAASRRSTTASWPGPPTAGAARPSACRRAPPGYVVRKPSTIAAISRPSGDHTGPKFSRMPIDLCGTGSNQRSGANAPAPVAVGSGSTGTHSTWLVPSRKRVEYGPQRRHHDRAAVGRPARTSGLVQSVVRLALLAARDVDDAAAAIRYRGRRAARRRATTPRWRRRPPRGDRARSADRGSRRPSRRRDRTRRRAACRRATTPGWSRRRRPGSGARARPRPLAGRRPATGRRARQRPRVRRRARSPGASGRAPAAGLRAANVVPLRRERRPGEGDLRGERHRAGRTAGARPPLDLAVGRVEQLARRATHCGRNGKTSSPASAMFVPPTISRADRAVDRRRRPRSCRPASTTGVPQRSSRRPRPAARRRRPPARA